MTTAQYGRHPDADDGETVVQQQHEDEDGDGPEELDDPPDGKAHPPVVGQTADGQDEAEREGADGRDGERGERRQGRLPNRSQIAVYVKTFHFVAENCPVSMKRQTTKPMTAATTRRVTAPRMRLRTRARGPGTS